MDTRCGTARIPTSPAAPAGEARGTPRLPTAWAGKRRRVRQVERGGRSTPPGTVGPSRFRPRLHYELLVCGARGHELLGTDVRELRPQDLIVARDEDGLRWHRCLRCDSWLPLPAPARPSREHMPGRDEVNLPLRGKALRDKIVLRVIAVDRALHFVILAALAVAVFLIASHEAQLRE